MHFRISCPPDAKLASARSNADEAVVAKFGYLGYYVCQVGLAHTFPAIISFLGWLGCCRYRVGMTR